MHNYTIPTHCPKCAAGLTDLWDGEPVSAFVGEWSDDRFHCDGKTVLKYVGKTESDKDAFAFVQEKSCGYFGLADFGITYSEES